MDLTAARPPKTRKRRRTKSDDPIGEKEVAALLGVKIETVYQWRYRNVTPPPDWMVNGLPAWKRSTIEDWAEETGRW